MYRPTPNPTTNTERTMPNVRDLLDPKCSCNRGHSIWDHGICWFCCQEKGLLPPPDEETKAWIDKLAYYANQPRVTYRSEPNCYDQDGVIDDD